MTTSNSTVEALTVAFVVWGLGPIFLPKEVLSGLFLQSLFIQFEKEHTLTIDYAGIGRTEKTTIRLYMCG